MFFLRPCINPDALKQMCGKTGFISVRVPPFLRRKIDLMCETYRLDKSAMIEDVLMALVDYVAAGKGYQWPVKVVHDEAGARESARAQEEVRAILQLKDPQERLRRLLGMDYVSKARPDPEVNDRAAELFRDVQRKKERG